MPSNTIYHGNSGLVIKDLIKPKPVYISLNTISE